MSDDVASVAVENPLAPSFLVFLFSEVLFESIFVLSSPFSGVSSHGAESSDAAEMDVSCPFVT